ncbi:MAG: CD225/dispanin family protein [Prevotellaceae bacterium]|jgi:hypothetical protein|nr:CD225/dispanin family protein [Prevotellaceae bacterium]
MSTYCSNCGNEVSEKAVVCLKCGASVSNANINKTSAQPPKTWLVESILVTLFCCLPFGIAGIVNASKVESRFYAGDIDGANLASASAGKWTKISLWVGVAVITAYILFYVVIIATSVAGLTGAGIFNQWLNL